MGLEDAASRSQTETESAAPPMAASASCCTKPSGQHSQDLEGHGGTQRDQEVSLAKGAF